MFLKRPHELSACGPEKNNPNPCLWITQGERMGLMGSIYKRGNVYWIHYYRNGKPYRETTKRKKEADVKRRLKKRKGEISEGKLSGVYFNRVRFDELAEDLIRDYRINGKKLIEFLIFPC